MLPILLFCCFTFVLSNTPFSAISDGVFNFPFVVDEDVSSQSGTSVLYLTTSHRCISSFQVSGPFKRDSTITVEKILRVAKDEQSYEWTKVGESTLHLNSTMVSLSTVVCASSWRLTGKSSQKNPWKYVTLWGEQPLDKRAVTCEVVSGDNYPPECSSASEGALCLGDTGTCGCTSDLDCFSNADFPYCVPDQKICDRCTVLAPGGTGSADHLFCRTRYPGRVVHPTTGDAIPSERAAPLNYFREVCIRTPVESSGACQRCNQAPLRPYGFPSQASNQGASGTYHCNSIRPNMPICMDQTYHTDCGVPLLYNTSLRGSCVPCSANAQCARALPNAPHCRGQDGSCQPCAQNGDCTGLPGQNNCQADGTCKSCATNTDCGALDGGEVKGSPVCDAGTGLCGPCQTNDQCAGTGGNNCQADGSCFTCKSSADCGAKDGGETPGQTLCNTDTGVCYSACTSNTDCVGRPGKNCQADGTCFTCRTDADCGILDGGTTANQTQCNNETGICVDPFHCTSNEMCVGHAGANCQKDGSCLSCTSETCGSHDLGDQPNCNYTSRLCIDACTNNSYCADTNGANCQANGVCNTCTTNADCGSLDGGEVPGQVRCDENTGICNYCAANEDCPVATANCGSDGFCFNCSALVATNCSLRDGPPGADAQPHCDAFNGICISGCTEDEHCPDPCAPRCDVEKHCCVECLDNTDCPHSDWRGEAASRETCATDTQTCVEGCSVDSDCHDLSLASCASHGECVECSHDTHCPEDRPACIVATGKCVQCTIDSHCEEFGLAACSVAQNLCVNCLFDAHCGTNRTCHVGVQKCVDCLFDFHCPGNKVCEKTVCTKPPGMSVGAIVGIAIGAFVVFVLAVGLIVVAKRQSDFMKSGEAQRLI